MAIKINEEIFSKLSTAIRQATDKSAKAEASQNEARMSESLVQAAESRISSAEAQVTRHQMAKQEAQEKLSPPPTKQVQGDGKKAGSKTVVDEREKDKLQSEVRAADVQIQQAQSAVATAREEADELKSKSLESVGISQEQQNSMSQLSSQIAELKTLVNDPQTDLTSQTFQDKLKKATEDTDKLQKALPDSANSTLKSYWDEIKSGFTAIKDKLTAATTPERATVDKVGDDYTGYFNDVDQGFETIINHVENNGGSRAQIMALNNAHDAIKNERGNYLGGMTSADDQILSDFLTHMNVMVSDINAGDAIDQAAIDTLTTGAGRVSDKLATNGSNFARDIVEPTFTGIAQNLGRIKEEVGSNRDFDLLLQKASALIEKNDASDLHGLTKEEYTELDAFYSLVSDTKDTAVNGGEISQGQLREVIQAGNTIFNKLANKYGLDTSTTATQGNGSSGSGGSGSSGGIRIGGRIIGQRG